MPYKVFCRLIAAALVAGCFLSLSSGDFDSVFFAMAMGHYLLALFYSWKQIKRVALVPETRLPGLGLLFLTVPAIYYQWPNMVLFFGVHHTLTESYVVSDDRLRGRRALMGGRLLMNAFAYCIMLAREPVMRQFSQPLMLAGFAAACAVFYYFLFVERRSFAAAGLREQVFFELALLAAVIVSLAVGGFTYRQLLFYHVAIWLFLPLPGLAKKGTGNAAGYLLATAAVSLACFAFTPLWDTPWKLSTHALEYAVISTGYAHVILSFGVSSLNPRWVQKIFAGRRLQLVNETVV
ncbi:MAG TPA: hypothetical protein VL688_06070 [Verrucomicrobiae bacterium]|nr:hypothetical protein [Verrucomicrobiae bacterium]